MAVDDTPNADRELVERDNAAEEEAGKDLDQEKVDEDAEEYANYAPSVRPPDCIGGSSPFVHHFWSGPIRHTK